MILTLQQVRKIGYEREEYPKNDTMWGHRDRTCPGQRRKPMGNTKESAALAIGNESKPGVGDRAVGDGLPIMYYCGSTLCSCSHHDIVTLPRVNETLLSEWFEDDLPLARSDTAFHPDHTTTLGNCARHYCTYTRKSSLRVSHINIPR